MIENIIYWTGVATLLSVGLLITILSLYLIKTYTNESETVLDFTMGGGTTGVACVNLNRKFIGIELDKDYFDISLNRIKERINELNLPIDLRIG